MNKKNIILIGLFLIVLFSPLIIAPWNSPTAQSTNNDTRVILLLDSGDNTTLSGTTFTNDSTNVNGTTNFHYTSSPNYFMDGGRDGNGALQYLASANNFLTNSTRAFDGMNESGGTMCFSWNPNGTMPGTHVIGSWGAGASSVHSGTLTWGGGNFLAQRTCASTVDIDVSLAKGYNTSDWFGICLGWHSTVDVVNTGQIFWYAVMNDYDIYGQHNISFGWGSATSIVPSCGGVPSSIGGGAAELPFRIGTGRNGDPQENSAVFDSFVVWNRNISIQDMVTYNRGNWSATVVDNLLLNFTDSPSIFGTCSNCRFGTPYPRNTTNVPTSIPVGTGAYFFNRSTIAFNITVNSTNSVMANVTINSSPGQNSFFNAPIANLSVTSTTFQMKNISLNAVLTDGDYVFRITVTDTEGVSNSTIPQYIIIDTISPNIDTSSHANESNNVTNRNLTFYFSVSDAKLRNVTLFISTNVSGTSQRVHTVHYPNVTGNLFSIANEYNITIEGNYTFELISNDGNGTVGHSNFNRRNISTYVDKAAPTINLTNVGEKEILTSQTPTFNFNTTDFPRNSYMTCNYHINYTSNGVVVISNTSFSCGYPALASTGIPELGNERNYTVGFEINDGVYTNGSFRNFRVDTAGAGGGGEAPPSGGGGGGGGGITTVRKNECNLIIVPRQVSLSTAERLVEIRITNNESFTYSPDIEIIGNELRITNPLSTILPGATNSFGIFYHGFGNMSGTGEIILSSERCEDETITVSINEVSVQSALGELFDEEKPLLENIINYLNTPVVKGAPAFKIWMGLLLFLFIGVLLTFRIIAKNIKDDKIVQAVAIVVFLIIVAIFLSIAGKVSLIIAGV